MKNKTTHPIKLPFAGIVTTVAVSVMLLVGLCAPPSTPAQSIRVNTYHYDDGYSGDVGEGATIAYTNVFDYAYSLGATNLMRTNTTGGATVFERYTEIRTTFSWQWDTGTDSLAEMFHADLFSMDTATNSISSGYDATMGQSPRSLPPDQNDRYRYLKTPGENQAVTLLQLILNDGDPIDIKTVFYAINIEATQDGVPIPGSEITVDTNRCDASSSVVFAFASLSTNDITTKFTSGYTNVYYKVRAVPLKPEIFFRHTYYYPLYVDETSTVTNMPMSTTNGIAGQTNSILIGEHVTLMFKMVDPSGNEVTSSPASDWVWTIGGKTVANYVATTALGEVTQLYPMNEATCAFYWHDATNGVLISCTATQSGQQVEAKTWFDVQKPDNNFQITVTGDIAIHLTTNGAANVDWGNPNGNPPVAGFTILYENAADTNHWAVVQIIKLHNTRKKIADSPVPKFKGVTITNALDTAFPFAELNDSPGAAIDCIAIWCSDTFVDYLLFNPFAPESIWVPHSISEPFTWKVTLTSVPIPDNPGTAMFYLDPATTKIPTNVNSKIITTIDSAFPKWTNSVTKPTLVPVP